MFMGEQIVNPDKVNAIQAVGTVAGLSALGVAIGLGVLASAFGLHTALAFGLGTAAFLATAPVFVFGSMFIAALFFVMAES